MRQLVQLQKSANRFQELNTEVILVYREEREGVEGLKKIQDKINPTYRLALDYNKKSSAAYSPKNKTFNNYVIDSKGVIRGVIDGTVRKRATAPALIEIIEQIDSESASSP